MIHTTHVFFAILLTLFLENFLHVPFSLPESILFVSIGALFPDIDHPSSYINRKSWRIFSLSGIAKSHRGWTHSLIGGFVFTAIVYLISRQYGFNSVYSLLFFFGYLSHLILDSLNPSGVAWFWPKRKRYGINLIGTGSFGETLFQFLLVIFIILHHYYSYDYNLSGIKKLI